jgi:hypothetical protein
VNPPRCRWCSKTLAQHRGEPALFTPRMPCLGLKSGFVSRGHSMVLSTDPWHLRALSRVGDWLAWLEWKVTR